VASIYLKPPYPSPNPTNAVIFYGYSERDIITAHVDAHDIRRQNYLLAYSSKPLKGNIGFTVSLAGGIIPLVSKQNRYMGDIPLEAQPRMRPPYTYERGF
jgi:hypothetical protein